jgi:hypothetical protein
MFALSRIVTIVIGLVFSFLRLAITPVKTTQDPAALPAAGAMADRQGIVQDLYDLKNNAAPVFGNWGQSPYSGVTNTWAAADMVAGIIRRYGAQSNADLTDTAANIIAQMPGAVVGQTFPLWVANMGLGTSTPQGGTGVTLVGSTAISMQCAKLYIGKVLGSASIQLTSCFQIGGAGPGGVAVA